MSNISGAGGNTAITVAAGDNLTVDSFGGFGTGNTPNQPSELDTLKFTGAGMTAANLILTQAGSDVVITFDGVANTQVTLTNTAIDQLENIAGQGNFRFFGQSTVTESIDVIGDTFNNPIAQHANSVSFVSGPFGFSGLDNSNDTIRLFSDFAGGAALSGGSGNDRLLGNAGSDILNGGTGADRMEGGAGDDQYFVDNVKDQVIETLTAAQGGGVDVVISTISYALGANVENLEIEGPSSGKGTLSGTGNDLDNMVTGSSLFDGTYVLHGAGGNDTIEAHGKLYGDGGDDLLQADGIKGSILDGGTGADTMYGAFGNDTYYVDDSKDVVSEEQGDGIDSVISSVSFTLGDGLEKLTLTGTDALTGTGNTLNNTITGNGGDNTLSGGDGNDTIHGGDGNDTIKGEVGNDTLFGDAGIDTLHGGDGNDLVRGGDGNDTLTGDAANDVLNGEAGDDTIDGGEGNDTASGGDGNDVITGGGGGDILRGGDGDDQLSGEDANDNLAGGAGNDILDGGSGDDKLDGGTGSDQMSGGAGNDIYVVDESGDTVTETLTKENGGGIDTVKSSVNFTLGENLDKLTLTGTGDIDGTGNGLDNVVVGNAGENTLEGGGGNDTLTGGAGNDILQGDEGKDRLDGGSGVDQMAGGAGDDVYVVDDSGDTVTETLTKANGGGIDSVQSSVDFTLGANLDNLTLTGTGDIDGTGNDLDNKITGNAGDNTLDGGDGNDTLSAGDGNDQLDGGTGVDKMQGGKGDDTYTVDNVGDKVTEQADQGTDQVLSSITYTLTANVENLTLTGSGDIDGTGNGLDNTLVGNSGANLLSGGGGNDTIFGGGGDTLHGDGGDDQLHLQAAGFKGVDGGTGLDRVYLDAAGSTIDLTGAGGAGLKNIEVIDLKGATDNTLTIDAQSVAAMSGGAAGANTLIIRDDVGDHVNLDNSWKLTGTQNDPSGQSGTYDVYSSGGSTLLIEDHGPAIATAPALDKLDGTNGFRIDGQVVSGAFGYSVGAAGDINGDGYDDVIVGSIGAQQGTAYVVYGSADGMPAQIETSALTGTAGFKITDPEGSIMGPVTSVGDLNGDGLADFAVGALFASPGGLTSAGSDYIVFGSDKGFGGELDLSTLDGSNGFRLSGTTAYSGLGWISSGDINGDGYDDLIVGAFQSDPNGLTDAGAAYVIFGHAGTFAPDLTKLDGTDGFKVEGLSAYAQLGFTAASAGDINGDGYDDIIIGQPGKGYGNLVSGSAYVLFGHAGGFDPSIDLSTLSASDGFKITGSGDGNRLGFSVHSAGDINGDGFDEIVVSAPTSPTSPVYGAGDVYVLYGKADGFSDIDVTSLTAAQGFTIHGANAGDGTGWTVTSAGDVNGDGYADIILGTPQHTAYSSGNGAAYLIYGHAGGFSDIDLAGLTASQGVKFEGLGLGDVTGYSVSSAGDLNGDGFADLIVGAYGADPDGVTDAGAAYVIYGGNFTGAVSHLGTNTGETLTGNAQAENFVAGGGDDIIVTGGGKDVIHAGAGNDQIQASDELFFQFDGGSGFDAINFDKAGAAIDLTGDLRSHISNIEVLDLTGGSDNVLTLDAKSVAAITGGNTLTVRDDAGDTVNLDSSWKLTGTEHNPSGQAGDYDVYTSGAMTLLVEHHDAAPLATVPTLDKLDGANGFEIDGATAGNLAGVSSGVGDFNGDGYADIILGTQDGSGDAYIVYGHAGGFGTTIDLGSLNATDGFKLVGSHDGAANAPDYPAFTTVASAGDINGDGIADFIVGSYSNSIDNGHFFAGTSYLVFGQASGFTSPLDLSNLSASQGAQINGFPEEEFGSSVASAGDVNGDGFDDLIIGARDHEVGGQFAAGAAYVLFGHAGAFDANLSSLDGTDGFRIDGANFEDSLGSSVASAGDINGDGFADIIVGAPHLYDTYADPATRAPGSAYVLFGHGGTFDASIDTANLDSADGFKISGIATNDRVGASVASAGDINGDGYADLVIGEGTGTHASNYGSGGAFVLFGKATGFSDIDLANLSASDGFTIHGANIGDFAGLPVQSAGDVNGDGYADIIVGAYGAGDNDHGAGYVVYGHAGGFGDVNLSQLDGSNGFAIDGLSASDFAGFPLSSGDVNGDGFSDIIVGSYADPNGLTDAGATYVIFGGNFTGAVTHLGSSAGETVTGSSQAESFFPGGGDDTIFGDGGKDLISAGSGNDQIHVADNTFFRVDGGSGSDTLHLDYAGSIDFANIDGNAATSDRGKISGIETISVDNGHNNDLTLHLADVVDINPQNSNVGGNATFDNVLKVDGNAGDTLHLAASDGWGAADTASLAGYAIYATHDVKVAVETTIAVTVN
jgi:Ca2+-binding RTX toxin-like protein